MRALLLLLVAAPAAAQTLSPEAAAFRAHVAVLAADDMRGREAGTADYDRAAAYVADQFKAAGVAPAGDADGYAQMVPMVAATPAGQGSVALVGADGGTRPLAFAADYLPAVSLASAATTLDTSVVFVGYGVVDAASGRDDYRGIDARGKVVAFFAGAPRSLQGEVRAHHARNKAAVAAERGAVGVITLPTGSGVVAASWARAVENWTLPG